MTSPYTKAFSALSTLPLLFATIFAASPATLRAQSGSKTITGQAAFTDYSQERPGVRRKITVADLPEPKEAESVDNGPTVIPRPDGAWPVAPPGFRVQLYAQGFKEPRLMRTAPNGDIFLADSHGDKIMVLRGVGPDGKAQKISTFAEGEGSGLNLPFRHRLLSQRPESQVGLHRQHRLGGTFPLQIW